MEKQAEYKVDRESKINTPSRYQISDKGDPRQYFTMIPNIIDDMDLSPFDVRLYLHLKRVAGEEGACWQSVSTLAGSCKMSAGSVVNARRNLEEAGLIECELVSNPNGGKKFIHIIIKDIWQTNSQKYTSTSPHERSTSCGERSTSPHEIKKNPIKNNPLTREGEGKKPRSSDDIRTGVEKSYQVGLQAHSGKADVSNYPNDIMDVLQTFCDLWHIQPPKFSRKGRTSAAWIESGRDLLDSCGEFGVAAIVEYRKDFEDYMRKHDGVAPHTVCGPSSLVNMVRAKAGKMRENGNPYGQFDPNTPIDARVKGTIKASDGRWYCDGVRID